MAAASAMSKAGELMDNPAYQRKMQESIERYRGASEDELEALERQSKRMGIVKPETSVGADKYAEVLERFTAKYPSQGLSIAMKAMELLPK